MLANQESSLFEEHVVTQQRSSFNPRESVQHCQGSEPGGGVGHSHMSEGKEPSLGVAGEVFDLKNNQESKSCHDFNDVKDVIQ